MRRIVLTFGVLLLASSAALAESVTFTLNPTVSVGYAGGATVYEASIVRGAGAPLFLNDINVSVNAPGDQYLSDDRNFFFASVPGTFEANDSYAGAVLRIKVAANTPNGAYFGSVSLLGGNDFFASDVVGSQSFELDIGPAPTATPTPTLVPTATPTEAPRCDAMPRAGCRAPKSTSLSLASVNGRQSMLWKWSGGAETQRSDFGDPIASSAGFAVCVYDHTGNVPSTAVSMIAAGGSTCGDHACWSQLRTDLRYRNRAADGIFEIQLRAAKGRTAIRVKANGSKIDIPAAASATRLLHQDPSVTVQLVQGTSQPCWEANYPAPAVRNTALRFGARLR